MVMDRARREFELIMKISAEPIFAAKDFGRKQFLNIILVMLSMKISSIILKSIIKE